MSIQPAIFSAHQTIDGIQTIPAVQNPGNAATSGTNQNAVVDPAAQNPVTQNSGAIPGTSTIQSPTSTANFNTGQSATANPPISSSSSSIPTQNVNASQTTSGVQNSGTPQPASTVHGHTRIQSRISIQNLATNTGPTIHGNPTSQQANPTPTPSNGGLLGLSRQNLPTKSMPWFVSPLGLLAQFTAQTTIILVICTLMHFSKTRNGLVGVPDTPSSFKDTVGIHQVIRWSYSLFWTTVPTWLMALYSAFWSALLAQLKSCQPMVELMKHRRTTAHGIGNRGWKQVFSCFSSHHPSPNQQGSNQYSTVKRTLLLDYNKYPPLADSIVAAVRNKHFLVSACMLIKSILFLAVGFSAAIFSTTEVSSNSTIQVTTSRFFDDYVWAELPDMQSAFDVISATLINGVLPLPWMTQNQSFLPFQSPIKLSNGNLTANTQSYSATSDCRIIDPHTSNITLELSGQNNTTPTIVNFGFEDRDCSIRTWITISSTRHRYVQTWSEIDCPGSTHSGQPWRVGIIAADFDVTAPQLLDNLSIISCSPSFWNSNANVTILSDETDFGDVVEFSTSSKEQIWPVFMPPLLRDLPQYIVFEPTGDSNSTLQLDGLARLIYRYAKTQDTSDTFASAVLSNSTSIVFDSMFAVFTTLEVYSPVDNLTISNATLSLPQTRLIIVQAPAIATAGIVAVAFLVTIWVWIYSINHKEELTTSMELILGQAVILEGSDIGAYIQKVEEDIRGSGGDLRMVDLVKHAENNETLNRWKCYLGDDGKIKLEPDFGAVLSR